MKNNLSKVIVIHGGEGVREEIKTILWKWFSKDTLIKPVLYTGLSEEIDSFKGHAELVVILEELANHTQIIVSQKWSSEPHFLVLGKEPKETDRISYAPTLESWKGYKQIHHL